MFDFDQTLSVFHVFKALAGVGDSRTKEGLPVPKPYAKTEAGQVRKIMELNEVPFKCQGGFASAAFGGSSRVDEMRRHLQRLRERDVEMVICTKGLVGPVRKCLLDLDLLPFFAEVYGNVGDTYGSTDFDAEETADTLPSEMKALLGSPLINSNWGSKDKLITRLMTQAGIDKVGCVLVEDDPEEIKKAAPVCQTLFVQAQAGMTTEHFDALHTMCVGDAAGNLAQGEVKPCCQIL